jgi:hypothetical protein
MAFAFSTAPTAGIGTISIARNGVTVTGVGTNFQSPSLVNQIILVNGFNSRVTAVASATSMTINRVPSYEITGEAFSHVANTVNINQTGADTDPSGLSALLGVNTYRVGIQAVYDLGVMRLALTGAAAVFSYDANRHCIVWSNQVLAVELTIGSGRTLTITGARADGGYTAPFYPRALAMPRVLPAGDSTFLPAHRSIINSGSLNISGVWLDTNQVDDLGGTATITECKWSSTDQQANFRLSAANVTINGLDLHNMPLTLLQSGTALNGIRFYNSGYTPVSLPAVAPGSPRIYTDWNFLGSLPLMNNFSGNANYVEFRNFGNWDGFKLATNSAVNMAARFVKNVSVNVVNDLGVGITDAIVYRLDSNNGNRTHYATDEHFIQATVSGVATGRILALVGRLPAGAANNSTQYTATMDCRNATNDQSGNDVLRYVSYEHLLANRNINTKGIGTLTSEQTLFHDPNVTLTRTNAIAKLASSFTVDPVTKVVTVTANSSFNDVYDVLKAYKATANALNLSTPTLDSLIITPNGTILEAFTGWSLVVNTGVTLSEGSKFYKIKFDNVTINGTGLITGVYETLAGISTVLQLNTGSDGYSLCLYNIDGASKYFASGLNAGSYYVYFAPNEAGIYTFAAEKYGEKRTQDVLQLFGGNVWYNITEGEDVGITDNFATASALTTVSTTSQIYDVTAIFRLTEVGIKLGQLVARDGLYLDFADKNVKFKDDASAIIAVVDETITYKSIVINATPKYNAMKATPPQTITATDTEIINVLVEDANGDSKLSILGGDDAGYELWKVPTTTATDNYATGTLLTTLSSNDDIFRFIGISGFDIVGRDISSGVRRRSSMLKGAYSQAFYVGNQIQLSTDAPQLIENNQKLDELLLKVDTKLDVAISTRLADADYVEPATPQNVLDAKTEVLEAIAEIPMTDISDLALEATSQAIKTTVEALENYDDEVLIGKVDGIGSLVIALENYDDTILISKVDAIQTSVDNIDVDFTPVLDAVATKPTLSQIEAGKVGDIKTKVDTLQNADFGTTNSKIDAVKAKVDTLQNADFGTTNSKIDAVKAKVDTLENYNDATAQTKLDGIKAKTDVLENADLTGIATATDVTNAKDSIETKIDNIVVDNDAIAAEVWSQEPERLKQVATVETTGDQLASFNHA